MFCFQATSSRASMIGSSTSMYSQGNHDDMEPDDHDDDSDNDSLIPKDATVKEIK